MTQAFNLSQFANKVNTSGQADLTTAVTGTLPIANGGTNNNALAVTAGGVLYTDGSKIVNVGAGTSGQILKSNGSSPPAWGSSGGTLLNIQYFTGSGTYTATSGTSFVIVEVVGGGGGSGGSSSTVGSTGIGGGGGGYARKTISSGFNGQSVTIGAGGSAGIPSAAGGAGGTSSFGSLVSATGGSGGLNASASAPTVYGGGGGAGSGGDINLNGGQGIGRTGGDSFYSSQTFTVANTGGLAGNLYGSGAGGAYSGTAALKNGAVGGSGIVIVYEYA